MKKLMTLLLLALLGIVAQPLVNAKQLSVNTEQTTQRCEECGAECGAQCTCDHKN